MNSRPSVSVVVPLSLSLLLALGCSSPREAVVGRSSAEPRPSRRPVAPPAPVPLDPARQDPARTPSRELVLRGTFLANPTAYIPAQCYTRTRDAGGAIHNPCYACHQTSRAPNYVDDEDLQLSYAFPEPALRNPWANLFVDRRAAVAAIPDEEILRYVRTDNYHDAHGAPVLARTLAELPPGWDVDGDGLWGGYVPDATFRFDERGFDRRDDGSFTGWRAFAYYPFLGTFFPTNGSTDDVLIRLPEVFRNDAEGRFDAEVYATNLAAVEALIRHEEREVRFVGAAGLAQERGELRPLPGLFPQGTEFLHSVRYVDVADDGEARLSARMKELRYARKVAHPSYGSLEQAALREAREDRATPDRTHEIVGDPEHGVRTSLGWVFQAFIEDREGALRPQTFEEHVACVGCHGGVGATTDGIFSFARRLPRTAFQEGWFHPSQRGLRGIPDPRREDGRPEYATYLRENGAGDELRGNLEVHVRFFTAEGRERREAFAALARDVSVLLLPSRERALEMAKAYLGIVRAQSYRDGRDAPLLPATEVHREIEAGAPTGLERPVTGPGFLRR